MPPSSPRRTLSLLDSICIIVGTIIGAGVFRTASDVAQLTPNSTFMIGIWVVAGIMVLVGAACFVELTTRFPEEAGGDYAYLKKAFGHPVAFMFAWAAFWIVRPANIGLMAIVFADHFAQLIDSLPLFEAFTPWQLKVGAALFAIGLLTAFNLFGLQQGKLAQNVLTIAKVAGIGVIIALAFANPIGSSEAVAVAPTAGTASWSFSALWLALVLVMFSFGGWNDLALVANEIREPKRNLWRALIFGIGIVTLVYVLFNVSLAIGLGQEGMAASGKPAIRLVEKAMGNSGFLAERASDLVAALVCISCLGAINGMIITSPRIYYAVGRDYPLLGFLARWNEEKSCPWQAIVLQAVVTIGLLALCAGYKNNIFLVLAVASAPYFWSFLGATVLTLFHFRSREESKGEHFRVPLFPFEPIFFAMVCGGLVYSSIMHVIDEGHLFIAIAIGGMMLVGVILGFLLKTHAGSAQKNRVES